MLARRRVYRSPLVLIAWTGTLFFAPGITAQDCTVDRDSDHADWHDEYVARRELELDLEAILREGGVLPFGRARISLGEERSAPTTTMLGLDLPPELDAAFRARVDAFALDHPVRAQTFPDGAGPADDTPASRNLTVQLGVPERPLWADSTVYCPPAPLNSDEIRDLMRAVGEQIRDQLGRPITGVRVRFEVWLLLNEIGQVETTTIELESGDEESWPGFEPYVRHILGNFRFRPASINGVPTTLWVTQALVFAF